MDATTWRTRATAWEFLAFSLRYPDAELCSAIDSGEWAETARELASVLALPLPAGWDEGAGSCSLSDLRAEATRLFIGVEAPECPAHEGLRRARSEGVKALYFINPHSVEVKHFLKACGLQSPEGKNEPLDHISTECELMEYLSLVAVGAIEPAAVEFPGGSAAQAYLRFLEEHLGVWVPEFAEDLEKRTRMPYYRTCARLLSAMVKQAGEEAKAAA